MLGPSLPSSLHQLINDAMIDEPIAGQWHASSRGINEAGDWITRARINETLRRQDQDGRSLHENLLTPLTSKPVLIDDSPRSRRFFSGVGAEEGRGAGRENSGPPTPDRDKVCILPDFSRTTDR